MQNTSTQHARDADTACNYMRFTRMLDAISIAYLILWAALLPAKLAFSVDPSSPLGDIPVTVPLIASLVVESEANRNARELASIYRQKHTT